MNPSPSTATSTGVLENLPNILDSVTEAGVAIWSGPLLITPLFLPLPLQMLLNMVGKVEIILISSAIAIIYFYLLCNLHLGEKKVGLLFSPRPKRLRSMKSLSLS